MKIKSIFKTRKGSYDVTEKLPGKYKLYEERWWMVAALGLAITLNILHFHSFPLVSKYAAQYYKQVLLLIYAVTVPLDLLLVVT